METLNLIDTIGVETGMHKYDEAFAVLCNENQVRMNIISNYSSKDTKLLLKNYYHGALLKKLCFLIADFFKLLIYETKYSSQVIIYQSFGFRIIDIFFFLPLMWRNNSYLLIHDLYELNAKQTADKRKNLKNWLYRHCIKNYICHSKSVKEKIECLCKGKNVKVLFVPHFEYSYSTEYNELEIPQEVRNTIQKNKTNLLFFGQVSLTKGIDILLKAFPLLDEKFNLIIAGMDKTGILKDCQPNERLHIINRYISDKELNYLFANIQIAVLPYREIYQSGVLETVIHFRKPAVMSSVQAFYECANEYSSFGICYSPNDSQALAHCINGLNQNGMYYNDSDMLKYKERHSIKSFLKAMGL